MFKFLKQKNKKNSSGFTQHHLSIGKSGAGFTLIEVLVAIAIFSLSLMTVMSVLASGTSDITYVKNKMVATYLAQEGIEYIRNMRDTYIVNDSVNGWSNFIKDTSTTSGSVGSCTGVVPYHQFNCYLNLTNFTNNNNSDLINCTGTYGACDNSTGVTSGFIRSIHIDAFSANEIKVSSSVAFKQGTVSKIVTFSEVLDNWVEQQ